MLGDLRGDVARERVGVLPVERHAGRGARGDGLGLGLAVGLGDGEDLGDVSRRVVVLEHRCREVGTVGRPVGAQHAGNGVDGVGRVVRAGRVGAAGWDRGVELPALRDVVARLAF